MLLLSQFFIHSYENHLNCSSKDHDLQFLASPFYCRGGWNPKRHRHLRPWAIILCAFISKICVRETSGTFLCCSDKGSLLVGVAKKIPQVYTCTKKTFIIGCLLPEKNNAVKKCQNMSKMLAYSWVVVKWTTFADHPVIIAVGKLSL